MEIEYLSESELGWMGRTRLVVQHGPAGRRTSPGPAVQPGGPARHSRTDHAASALRTSAIGCRAPIRAGTIVSAAIATSVPSAAATSQVTGGRLPCLTATLKSP